MNASIGENIRIMRRKCGFTQEELAAQLSVTPQAVSKWENGGGMPDLSLIVPLAQIFGITTDSLLGAASTVYGKAHTDSALGHEKLIMSGNLPVAEKHLALYSYFRVESEKEPTNYNIMCKCINHAAEISRYADFEDFMSDRIDERNEIFEDCERKNACISRFCDDKSVVECSDFAMAWIYIHLKEFDKAKKMMGGQAIANKLNEMGIRTAQGNLWTAPRIKELLSNEKYIGNMLLQKYYRNNHIEKKKTRNNGELQQILVEEAHEPIIDRETFDMAQRILAERHRKYSHEGATNRYSLSGMIKCGCCGKNYQRKMYSQGAVWMCATYLRRGKKHCSDSRQISEKILFQLIGDMEVTHIDVPKPNELIFTLANGTKIQKHWENPSRSESWTPEMKEKARMRSCRK